MTNKIQLYNFMILKPVQIAVEQYLVKNFKFFYLNLIIFEVF